MTTIIIKAITRNFVYVISNHGSYVYINMYNMILYKVLTKFEIPVSENSLENIAEFSALVLEHRKSFLGKRIDIASDEVTGDQAAKILSNELGERIRYVHIPLEQVYQANEDMARMYEWYERVRTGIDITSLHQEYPEVNNWLTFKDWARSRLR